jgi:nucleotide-binding universal stress UspA family protein
MISSSAEPTRTVVLIAVDGTVKSERVVSTSYRLFGHTAEYLAINVGPGPYSDFSWAYVAPIGGATSWYPSAWSDDLLAAEVQRGVTEARAVARAVTNGGGLVQATPLGEVGDPASAILRAAHHHHADVIVVGEDDRSWVSRLFTGSVEQALLREGDVSVLVVADTGPPLPDAMGAVSATKMK